MVKEISEKKKKKNSVGYTWHMEWRKLFPVHTKCNTNVELRKNEKKIK